MVHLQRGRVAQVDAVEPADRRENHQHAHVWAAADHHSSSRLEVTGDMLPGGSLRPSDVTGRPGGGGPLSWLIEPLRTECGQRHCCHGYYSGWRREPTSSKWLVSSSRWL